MPGLLELDEEVVEERQQRAAERRDRNALAIAEVVGRNPAKKEPDDDFPFCTRRERAGLSRPADPRAQSR